MHSKGRGAWQACMFCKKKRVSLYNIGLEGDIIVFVLRYEIVLTQIDKYTYFFNYKKSQNFHIEMQVKILSKFYSPLKMKINFIYPCANMPICTLIIIINAIVN